MVAIIRQYDPQVVEQRSPVVPVQATRSAADGLGEAMQDFGSAAWRVEEHIATAHAYQVDADWANFMRETMRGDGTEGSGYLNTRGMDAVNGRESLIEQVQNRYAQMVESLNPLVRPATVRSMEARWQTFLGQVNDHATAQARAAVAGAGRARVDASTLDALSALANGDTEGLGTALQVGTDTIMESDAYLNADEVGQQLMLFDFGEPIAEQIVAEANAYGGHEAAIGVIQGMADRGIVGPTTLMQARRDLAEGAAIAGVTSEIDAQIDAMEPPAAAASAAPDVEDAEVVSEDYPSVFSQTPARETAPGGATELQSPAMRSYVGVASPVSNEAVLTPPAPGNPNRSADMLVSGFQRAGISPAQAASPSLNRPVAVPATSPIQTRPVEPSVPELMQMRDAWMRENQGRVGYEEGVAHWDLRIEQRRQQHDLEVEAAQDELMRLVRSGQPPSALPPRLQELVGEAAMVAATNTYLRAQGGHRYVSDPAVLGRLEEMAYVPDETGNFPILDVDLGAYADQLSYDDYQSLRTRVLSIRAEIASATAEELQDALAATNSPINDQTAREIRSAVVSQMELVGIEDPAARGSIMSRVMNWALAYAAENGGEIPYNDYYQKIQELTAVVQIQHIEDGGVAGFLADTGNLFVEAFTFGLADTSRPAIIGAQIDFGGVTAGTQDDVSVESIMRSADDGELVINGVPIPPAMVATGAAAVETSLLTSGYYEDVESIPQSEYARVLLNWLIAESSAYRGMNY